MKRKKSSLSTSCEEIKFFNQDNIQFFRRRKKRSKNFHNEFSKSERIPF